jgi:hypothetical protein
MPASGLIDFVEDGGIVRRNGKSVAVVLDSDSMCRVVVGSGAIPGADDYLMNSL